jgi:farnesyl diphosphate synthase
MAWVPQDAPAGLGEAMRYGVLDGGKRLRPLLVLAACQAVAGDRAAAMRAAVAVELIHAYSLVHDDMPCMDNDVLRRGKPTVHVQYGQAQAMLAGDAMQALAFEVLTPDTGMAPALQARLWRCWRGPPGMPAWPAARPWTWPAWAVPWAKPSCATCTAARPAPCSNAAC